MGRVAPGMSLERPTTVEGGFPPPLDLVPCANPPPPPRPPPPPLPLFEAKNSSAPLAQGEFKLTNSFPCLQRRGRGDHRNRGGSGQPPPSPLPPVSGTADPGVVKQDKSSRGSVDTTKTRAGPQRVRMSSSERPIGAAKGKQSDTGALCQTPPPPSSLPRHPWVAPKSLCTCH